MQIVTTRFAQRMLGALFASALLAGCSSWQQASLSIPPTSLPTKIKPDPFINHLYVVDAGRVATLDSTYSWLGDVTGNNPCPSGGWVTRTGPARLYVANFGCNGTPEITEFKSLNNAPYGTFQFHYTTSLIDPLIVTTDSVANVYASDYGGSHVTEFAQLSNTVLNTCQVPTPTGVAVNANGDVFVSEVTPGLTPHILRFPGPAGLANCSAGAPIAATLPGGFGGGELLLDNNSNLIMCDQSNGVYKIAGPSYSTVHLIPSTASFQCFHMSLNSAGNYLFITEPFKTPQDIQVIKYPSGTFVTTVVASPANHLQNPVGVAAFPG